jgi:hypothetical protein
VISVAIDWASRYLALPASSPGLAVDPPEEGGFGIGHKAMIVKRRGHTFLETKGTELL